MTQQQKIRKAEKLFDEIVEMFPEGSASMEIHSLNMKKLDKKWKVKAHVTKEVHAFLTAERNDKTFDITLFG